MQKLYILLSNNITGSKSMKRILKYRFVFILLAAFLIPFISQCSDGGGGGTPTTGTITGTVRDESTNAVLAGVRIIVFNANTNAPAGNSLTSSATGKYSVELEPGSYYLKLAKQGYINVPAPNVTPIPVTVDLDSESVYDVQMTATQLTNIGYITGRVLESATGVAGAMVVADNGTNAYSSITDVGGYYYIYNVPVDTYTVKSFISGKNAAPVTGVIVLNNTQATAANITITSNAAGCVKGSLSFLATTAVSVDVSLVHPVTHEAIPGLTTFMDTAGGANYIIRNVPAGNYIARASYQNDGRVVDPDWIIKFGEPSVTVNNDTITKNFSLTGSVTLNSPTNPQTSTTPFTIPDSLPRLQWTAYPGSTAGYVIEVTNSNGSVIWGGFTNKTRNFILHKDSTAVNYNYNGLASNPLIRRNIYRWRVFACKNENGADSTGWGYKLISVSEEQRGLIKFGN